MLMPHTPLLEDKMYQKCYEREQKDKEITLVAMIYDFLL